MLWGPSTTWENSQRLEEGVVGVIGWENWEGREEEREREREGESREDKTHKFGS